MSDMQYLAPSGGSIRDSYQSLVTPYFRVGDFSFNLTFRPNLRPKLDHRGEDVRQFLRLANTTLLGRNSTRKLNQVHVFEWDAAKTALHVHGILENPIDCIVPAHQQIDVIMGCWMKLNCSGYYAANVIKPVYEVEVWVDYMLKNINRHSTDLADITRWTLNSR